MYCILSSHFSFVLNDKSESTICETNLLWALFLRSRCLKLKIQSIQCLYEERSLDSNKIQLFPYKLFNVNEKDHLLWFVLSIILLILYIYFLSTHFILSCNSFSTQLQLYDDKHVEYFFLKDCFTNPCKLMYQSLFRKYSEIIVIIV